MNVVRVTATLDVTVPGDGGCTDAARTAVTNALTRIVDPMKAGITISGASVDRVERLT
jgi:hypothetical protein